MSVRKAGSSCHRHGKAEVWQQILCSPSTLPPRIAKTSNSSLPFNIAIVAANFSFLDTIYAPSPLTTTSQGIGVGDHGEGVTDEGEGDEAGARGADTREVGAVESSVELL